MSLKLSYLMVANAVFALICGLGLLLMPIRIWEPYGANLNQLGIFESQLMGSLILGLAVISWNGRNIKEKRDKDIILPGFFLAHAVAAVLAVMALNSGVLNSLVWIDILAHGVLAAGFGYYVFLKR